MACTKELLICSDGSGVGRNSYNNCEFDPCPIEVSRIPQYLQVLFLTYEGALPLTTEEQLSEALDSMYNYRVGLGLDVMMMIGMMPPPDMSSCSSET